MEDIRTQIQTRLEEGLHPVFLEIQDESKLHIGHVGASGGGGHYAVKIVSAAFEGKEKIEQHRLVYSALGELFPTQIHALALTTLTPSDWEKHVPPLTL